MSKKIIVLFILLSAILSVRVYSYTISGRLLDLNNFPVPLVTIYVNGFSSYTTAKDGTFSFMVDKLPYDLCVVDQSNLIGVLYKNLTSQNPELTLFGDIAPRAVNSEYIKVEFPQLTSGKSAIIKFVSNDVFYSKEELATPGENSKLIKVDWLKTNNNINGKVIFIEKTAYSFGRYFERSYTVMKDFYPQQVKFDSLSYNQNIGDSYISVFMPSVSYDRKGFSVYADFLSLHRNAEILLNETQGDIISTKILIPNNLPNSYRLRVAGYGSYKNNSGFTGYYYTYPNSTLNIESVTSPQLSGPQDKFYNVNNNTLFSFDWGAGSGVAVYNFHSYSPVGDFYVVTNETSIRSPLNFSYGMITGDDYSWNVSKYIPYLSVDDFVKAKNFGNDVGYKAVTTSETRTFRTKF